MSWTDIAAQCVFYFILWFFSLFIVLPFGIKREENPEPGHDTGAPKNPALLKRFLATSILAFVFWAIFFYVTVIRGFTMQHMFR